MSGTTHSYTPARWRIYVHIHIYIYIHTICVCIYIYNIDVCLHVYTYSYVQICSHIENACGESPPPPAFGELWLDRQTGVWSGSQLERQKCMQNGSEIDAKIKEVGFKILQNSLKVRSKTYEHRSLAVLCFGLYVCLSVFLFTCVSVWCLAARVVLLVAAAATTTTTKTSTTNKTTTNTTSCKMGANSMPKIKEIGFQNPSKSIKK